MNSNVLLDIINKLPMFLLINIIFLILCLISKTIRKIVYTIIISIIIPFILAVIQKFGLALGGINTYFEKFIYNSFSTANKLGLLFLTKKELIIFVMNVEKEMYIFNFSYINLFAYIKLLLISSFTKIKNIELEIKNEFNNLEEKIVRRINMSKLSINYRV